MLTSPFKNILGVENVVCWPLFLKSKMLEFRANEWHGVSGQIKHTDFLKRNNNQNWWFLIKCQVNLWNFSFSFTSTETPTRSDWMENHPKIVLFYAYYWSYEMTMPHTMAFTRMAHHSVLPLFAVLCSPKFTWWGKQRKWIAFVMASCK